VVVQDSVPVEVAIAVEVAVTGPVVTGPEPGLELVPVGPTDAGDVSVADPVLEAPVEPPTDPVDVPTVVAPVPEGEPDPVDVPTVVAPVPEGEPLPDVEAVALPVLVDPPLGGGTAVDEDLEVQLRVRVGRTAAEDDGTTM
jgi:hypothetical protein